MWIGVWLLFWIAVMGLPVYVFKRYGFTMYEHSLAHTTFYIFAILALFLVYGAYYMDYFNLTPVLFAGVWLLYLVAWLLVPRIYKQDYYSKEERIRYQIPKMFEIVFQQLCFLGGLLTSGFSPLMFGLLFFAVHVPMAIFVPNKFAVFVIVGSLLGGLIFAYLMSFGIIGFTVSLGVHFLFWLSFHYILSSERRFGLVPLRR